MASMASSLARNQLSREARESFAGLARLGSFALCRTRTTTLHPHGLFHPTRLPYRCFSSTPLLTSKEVQYTLETYPNLKRDPRFAELTKEDVDHFRSILQSETAVVDGWNESSAADLEGFNTDWMRKYRGQSKVVLKPKSAEEVSKIMKYCTEKKLAVVPQGGNTGLVGGSIPVFDEVILSLSAMNQIRSFDEVSGALVCDAGCILEVVDNFLAEKGHIFPLDLGAKGSCHVGGNLATNAGGLRLLRYGNLHGSVLGIEAVLPDGTIVDDLMVLRKNNTGFDLKQLFIGSEGSIGIITGASIQCPQRSKAVNVAYFGLQSFDHVKLAFVKAKKDLGEILSAFEMMDGYGQNMVHQTTGKNFPLSERYPFYILIETSGSSQDHDMEKLERFLESVMEEEIVSDGVLAQDRTQAKALWTWREGIPEAMQHHGGTYKYDVSLPIADFYALIEDTRKRLNEAGVVASEDDDGSKPVVEVVGYGHMGDQNLHLNIAVTRYEKEVEKLLEPWVFEWISSKKGSISAEHGLGLQKKNFVQYTRDETSLDLMRKIKNLFDPLGIMNPYKYIPVSKS